MPFRKPVLRGFEEVQFGSGVSEALAAFVTPQRSCTGTMMTGHCDSMGAVCNFELDIDSRSRRGRDSSTDNGVNRKGPLYDNGNFESSQSRATNPQRSGTQIPGFRRERSVVGPQPR